MAKTPSGAYLGTDEPEDRMLRGSPPGSPRPQYDAPRALEPSMGDGGGNDPSLDPGSEGSAWALVQQRAQEYLGLDPGTVGSMPVDEIVRELSHGYPDDLELMQALDTLSRGQGASVGTDPGLTQPPAAPMGAPPAGGSDMMRFNPDQPMS